MNSRYVITLAALTLTLAACMGTPTLPAQFYLLSPDPGQPVAGRSTAAPPLAIGLGPVTLPEIYDRPQIVTRTDNHQIQLAEFDRWGGELDKDLTRTLARNLMDRLNTHRVALYPWSGRNKPDFQISIQFFRLDGQLEKSAVLNGVWRLLDGDRGCELVTRRVTIEEPTGGTGYPGLVAALSRGVARLSQEIAEQVVETTPGCK